MLLAGTSVHSCAFVAPVSAFFVSVSGFPKVRCHKRSPSSKRARHLLMRRFSLPRVFLKQVLHVSILSCCSTAARCMFLRRYSRAESHRWAMLWERSMRPVNVDTGRTPEKLEVEEGIWRCEAEGKPTLPSQVQKVPVSLTVLLSMTGIIFLTDSSGEMIPSTGQSRSMLAMSLTEENEDLVFESRRGETRVLLTSGPPQGAWPRPRC